jgi:hypothetical protein
MGSMFYLTLMSKGEKRTGLSAFVAINAKGGEKNRSGCLCCNHCQRGRLLACFTGSVCLSLMASATTMMDCVQEGCARWALEVFWEDAAKQARQDQSMQCNDGSH